MEREIYQSEGTSKVTTYQIVGNKNQHLISLLKTLVEQMEKGEIFPELITLDSSGSDTYLTIYHDYRHD